jgi:hypothetical protein
MLVVVEFPKRETMPLDLFGQGGASDEGDLRRGVCGQSPSDVATDRPRSHDADV